MFYPRSLVKEKLLHEHKCENPRPHTWSSQTYVLIFNLFPRPYLHHDQRPHQLLCGWICLLSTSFRNEVAMPTSVSNNGLLQENSHSQPKSLQNPICWMVWFCWLEMRYSLGYLVANTLPAGIRTLHSIFIYPPSILIPRPSHSPLWIPLIQVCVLFYLNIFPFL